eukprot:756910-Hanusia_phi.AAC.2
MVRAVVVGGSSGMGSAFARHAVKQGGEVIICSRSQEKLDKAAEAIAKAGGEGARESVRTQVLDNTDEEAVKKFFEELPPSSFDTLVITALGRAAHGSFLQLDTAKAREVMEGKLWGPWYCAKYGAPKMAEGGAIVFVSGVLNRRPGLNCSPLGAANGAVEALTRSLALELGPQLRVNCLSPGFVDTERFDHMDAEKKAQMMDATAASLPLKCVGDPDVIGEALYFLATNKFTTGVVLDVDGGHQIRQYALPNDVYNSLRANGSLPAVFQPK